MMSCICALQMDGLVNLMHCNILKETAVIQLSPKVAHEKIE